MKTKRLLRRAISAVLQRCCSGIQKEIVRELLNRNSIETPRAKHSYGVFPAKVSLYEEFYNFNTGGWLNGNTEEYGSVELEVGRFWYAFVRLIKPKNILETGTYKGYSTCCIATALRDIDEGGHLYTIDPELHESLWENTDLESFITPVRELSQNSIPFIKDKIFDLLVLDSDHTYNTVAWELIHFEKLLKTDGYILMHDTLFYDGVGAAVSMLYNNPRFEVLTMSSPRNYGNPVLRCPGISVIKKTSAGSPELKYDMNFDGWFIGDHTSPPYLYRAE